MTLFKWKLKICETVSPTVTNGPTADYCAIPHVQPTRCAVERRVEFGSAVEQIICSDASVLARLQLHSSKLKFNRNGTSKIPVAI